MRKGKYRCWTGVDDFFVGIGDINGSFLPPTSPNTLATNPNGSSPSPSADAASPTDSLTQPETSSLIARVKLLDEVSEARPLAKLQEELEKKDDAEFAVATEGTETLADGAKREEAKSTTPPGSPTTPRKPLLNAFDDELIRVAGVRKPNL